jgi:hypothetical protein
MKEFAGLLIMIALVAAAPAPPEIIINNMTMECSEYNAGDECTSCAIPDGWTSLGRNTAECPDGYAEADANVVCTPAINPRCCSEGHSGAMGGCDRMVVNRLGRQCRFLSENEGIPPGWEGMADGTVAWECPEGFVWIENAGPCPFPAALIGALAVFAFIPGRKSGKAG